MSAQFRQLSILLALFFALAGVGTAGFFLLLTVKWVVPASLFGVLALAATLIWVWQTDRPPVAERVEVATGRFLPVGAPELPAGYVPFGRFLALLILRLRLCGKFLNLLCGVIGA